MSYRYTTHTICRNLKLSVCDVPLGAVPVVLIRREQTCGSEMKEESYADMFLKMEVSCELHDYTNTNEPPL